MSAPLNKVQKAYLAQLSNRAFNLACAKARGAGAVTDWDAPADPLLRDAEHFRHAQVALACGKMGLRCCSQDDYKVVEGHFLELLGQHGAAFESQVKAATEKKRVAQYKVIEACKEFGFSIGYAAFICRQQNRGAPLEDLDEGPLWRLVYTIRNRGAANRRKRKLAEAKKSVQQSERNHYEIRNQELDYGQSAVQN